LAYKIEVRKENVKRKFAMGLAAVALLTLGVPMGQTAERKPNVVIIFADDLGYGDLGCYGATRVKTPNIDRLAAQGRMFIDAHSASAVCTPSRYALITGEYPVRKNLYPPVFLKTGLLIDTQQQTISSLMKEAGYATACIGKWHLGFGRDRPDWNGELKPGPLELGFDYYFGVPVVNSHPPFVYVENHRVVGLVPDDPFVFKKKAKTRAFPEKMGLSQIGGADAAHALYDDEMVGTKLTGKALEWIKGQKDGPFFLYLATTNIHHPFTPHPRFKGTSECGRYGDFIHELDWIVGEIMKGLNETGVADNTLLVFTSDNGGMFNQGGQDAWIAGHTLNGKLLGFKFDAWEGGHRVPFIARWPGRIKAGSTSKQLICNVDMIATLAALTGTPVKAGQGQDSVNILPALIGEPEKPLRKDVLLAARQPSHLALRKGKWMYINARGGGGFNSPKRGAHAFGGPAAITFTQRANSDIENGKIKTDAPPAQLYDLETDLPQTENLYHEYPAIVEEMKALLRNYMSF
jgi:arylsulfatase A